MNADQAQSATHWNELTMDYDPVMSSDPAYRRMLAKVIELVPPRTIRLLDLGCGTGALTRLCHRTFPEAEIVGVDPAPRMLEQARLRCPDLPPQSFLEGTASYLGEFPPEHFDAVVSNFALHHLSHEDKKRCAQEVFRVLKRGGRFVFADQHCQIMGDVSDKARALHLLELLTAKAKYYLFNAGIERMLLQLDLLPRFIREDGEIMATPEFWRDALIDTGFVNATIEAIEPREIMNRVIWADKKDNNQPPWQQWGQFRNGESRS